MLRYLNFPCQKYEICMRIWFISQKAYFCARPRAVASSIDLKLRHDGVHHVAVADVLTKFRVFRRTRRRISDPSATYFKKAPKGSENRLSDLLAREI
jgi:hypothetical protein